MKKCAVILAAGDGKRMKSERPKVLCEVLFKPMLDWVLDAAEQNVSTVCVVTGHGGDLLSEHLGSRAATVRQSERLGTGHAVYTAIPFIQSQQADHVLVLNGDAPLMDAQTIADAFEYHVEKQNEATVISAKIKKPYGYGRIVRSKSGQFTEIVEEKDADKKIRKIQEINSGAYWFSCRALLEVLPMMTNDNRQGEYYLTQTIELLKLSGGKCGAYQAPNRDVVLGANDRMQLLELNECARRQVLAMHMENGVSIPCADGLIISPDVTIEPDSEILPGSLFYGQTTIGKNCKIGPGVVACDAKICDGIALHHVELYKTTITSDQIPRPYQSVHGPRWLP